MLGVAFSPDGRTLASGGFDGRTLISDVPTRRRLVSLPSKQAVNDVAFSPDGRSLASASTDARIRITRGLRLVRQLTGHSDSVSSVAFAPDGRTLASASFDDTVRLWDTRRREAREVINGFEALRAEVCALVGGGLSRTEWARFADGFSYRDSCA